MERVFSLLETGYSQMSARICYSCTHSLHNDNSVSPWNTLRDAVLVALENRTRKHKQTLSPLHSLGQQYQVHKKQKQKPKQENWCILKTVRRGVREGTVKSKHAQDSGHCAPSRGEGGPGDWKIFGEGRSCLVTQMERQHQDYLNVSVSSGNARVLSLAELQHCGSQEARGWAAAGSAGITCSKHLRETRERKIHRWSTSLLLSTGARKHSSTQIRMAQINPQPSRMKQEQTVRERSRLCILNNFCPCSPQAHAAEIRERQQKGPAWQKAIFLMWLFAFLTPLLHSQFASQRFLLASLVHRYQFVSVQLLRIITLLFWGPNIRPCLGPSWELCSHPLLNAEHSTWGDVRCPELLSLTLQHSKLIDSPQPGYSPRLSTLLMSEQIWMLPT